MAHPTWTARGQCIVITGAAGGIGQALANNLAAQGARLLLCDVDAERLAAVVEPLRAQGVECLSAVADVADPQAWVALAAQAQAAWGGADVLVNNAGVGLVAPVESMALADAQWLMGINFWGVVHGCRAFIPLLRGRPGAAFVNISSIFAMVSMPTQGMYNAAKAGVRAFSDALREELRPDAITVLCVHPGGVRTGIVERSRLGDIRMLADSRQVLVDGFAEAARCTPDAAAAAIVGAIQRGQTRLLIGADARLLDWLFRWAPARASAWFSALARHQRQRQRQRQRG